MTDQSSQNQEVMPLPPLRKRLERTAGRVCMRLLVRPLRAMPLSLARTVGRGLGFIMFHSLGRYRRVALKNLALVYGSEYDEAKRAKMAYAVFRHFGQMAAEFVKLPALSREQVDRLTTVD